MLAKLLSTPFGETQTLLNFGEVPFLRNTGWIRILEGFHVLLHQHPTKLTQACSAGAQRDKKPKGCYEIKLNLTQLISLMQTSLSFHLHGSGATFCLHKSNCSHYKQLLGGHHHMGPVFPQSPSFCSSSAGRVLPLLAGHFHPLSICYFLPSPIPIFFQSHFHTSSPHLLEFLANSAQQD